MDKQREDTYTEKEKDRTIITTKVKSFFVFLALLVSYLFFGILNNVGAAMMGYVMPAYPAWLLYGTTILYVILFYCISMFRKQNPFARHHLTWPRYKNYLWLAFWTALNGIFFQFADPWIDPDLQQILVCLQVPATFVFAKILFKNVLYNKREIAGTIIVLAGIAVGVIPYISGIIKGGNITEQGNYWYWVLAFLISVLFSSVEQVWQERAFQGPDACEEAPCLFWYNLLSLPVYVMVIPCEAVRILNGTKHSTPIRDVFANQKDAFACYFGHASAAQISSGDCAHNAWIWPTIFVIGYAGDFFLNAVLIKRYNAFYAVIVGSLIQPLSVLVFAWEAVVGSANYKPVHLAVVISFIIILFGVIVKSEPKKEKQGYEPLN